jgi:hypothetical protein
VNRSTVRAWLKEIQPIPPWAIRAAYFAAMQSGVPLRFNNPIATFEQIERALYAPLKDKAPNR